MPTAAGPPDRAARKPPDGPTGLNSQEAERLVAEASERLWRPEGADALAYLRVRCLTDEIIRAARLGWTPRVTLPTAHGIHFWQAAGIVLGAIEIPERPTRDEESPPSGLGIVSDRPARPTLARPVDGSDRHERAAIMEFDGGLTREAAENAARLYT